MDNTTAFEKTETTERKLRGLYPINMQLFAHSNGGDSSNGEESGSEETGGNGTENSENENTAGAEKSGSESAQGSDDNKDDDLEKKIDQIVQSRVDRLMAKERKENAETKKALEKLRKEKLTADELDELAKKEREKKLEEKEKEITEKENRFFAITAIKKAGLDDGSDKALALVDLVITGNGDTEETITKRVEAMKAFISSRVAAAVDAKFKENGRNPDNSGSNKQGDDKSIESIAAQYGKQKAEQDKKANDILAKYTGGKK